MVDPNCGGSRDRQLPFFRTVCVVNVVKTQYTLLLGTYLGKSVVKLSVNRHCKIDCTNVVFYAF